jgi:hypothetical protein
MSGGLKPGDALWIRFPHSEPPKSKICLCVCVEENIFLVISSKPYKAAPADSQLAIYPEELSILDHTSYLDTSKYYDDFPLREIEKGIRKGVHPLSRSAREKIIYAVSGQPYLMERVKKKILRNLSF